MCGCQGQSATAGGAEIGAAGWKNRNSRLAEMVESLAVRQSVSQGNCVSGAEQHTPQGTAALVEWLKQAQKEAELLEVMVRK